MRPPTGDFTEIELQFLGHVWVWRLRQDGATVDDALTRIILERVS
jgi:hypothetical protein